MLSVLWSLVIRSNICSSGSEYFEVCYRHSICLYMECIPCSLNDKAGYISCIRDFDDWKVNPERPVGGR